MNDQKSGASHTPPQPAWTAGALALIACESRLLLVRRAYGSHQWGLPGGYIEIGETPQFAILRELREELGVAALVTSFVGIYVKIWESNINFIFAVRLKKRRFELDLAEIEDAHFFPCNALPNPMSERHRVIILDCQDVKLLPSLWVFKTPGEQPIVTRGLKTLFY